MGNNETRKITEADELINPNKEGREMEQGQILPEQLVLLMGNRLESGSLLNDSLHQEGDELIKSAPEDLELMASIGAIQEKSHGLWKTAKEKIMRAGAIGLAILAFSGAGEFGPASAQAVEKAPATLVSSEIMPQKEKSPYKTKMDELKKAALTEAKERYVVFAGTNGKCEPVFEGIGKDTSLELDLDRVDKNIKTRKTTEIEIVHTHPLVFLKTFFPNADTKKDKMANIMPPSFQDIQFAILTNEHFLKNGVTVKNSVIESTGKWELSVDSRNGFVGVIVGLYKDDLPRVFNGMSKSEKEIIRKEMKDYFVQADPRTYLSHLLVNPRTKIISERLQTDLAKIVNKKMEKFQDDDFVNIVLLPDQITAEIDVGKKKKMITQYIESARKKGINIKYLPFEEGR